MSNLKHRDPDLVVLSEAKDLYVMPCKVQVLRSAQDDNTILPTSTALDDMITLRVTRLEVSVLPDVSLLPALHQAAEQILAESRM